MATPVTKDTYWTPLDEHHANRNGELVTLTYEHALQHGKLVRTVTVYQQSVSEAIVFVPAGQPAC